MLQRLDGTSIKAVAIGLQTHSMKNLSTDTV